MKVLYHHRTQGTGAEGVHIAYVIKGLTDLGHSVDVISPYDTDPRTTAGNNPFSQKKGLRKKILSLLSKYAPQSVFEMMEMLYNRTATCKLTKQLDNKPVDLMYERYAFFLSSGCRIAKQRKIPFIVEVNEIVGEKRVRNQVFVNKAKRIEREVFEQADAIIVVSRFLKQKIADQGIDEDKIHVIANGVDISEFDSAIDGRELRKANNISEETVIIGFIGWFVPWHKLERLITIFSKLDMPNTQLMLVGDGLLKDELMKLAKQTKVADRVIFTGPVLYQNIPEYVSAMDICVIPESNDYRSPIKMFEYMAMGKAVLAPDYEPIVSVIEHGKDGFIFDRANEEDYAYKLSLLAQDKQLRDQLGIHASETIIDRHLWIHNAQRVLDIYNDVKGERS